MVSTRMWNLSRKAFPAVEKKEQEEQDDDDDNGDEEDYDRWS